MSTQTPATDTALLASATLFANDRRLSRTCIIAAIDYDSEEYVTACGGVASVFSVAHHDDFVLCVECSDALGTGCVAVLL